MAKLKYCLRLLILVSATLMSAIPLWAQHTAASIDSFHKVITAAKSDTARINLMLGQAEVLDCTDSLFYFDCVNNALKLSEQIKWHKGLSRANSFLGNRYLQCYKQYETAVKYFEKARGIAETSGNKPQMIDAIMQLGLGYQLTAQYSRGIACYEQLLASEPGLDYKISALGNMGQIYSKIGDFARSLTCYDSSLKILDEYLSTKKNSDAYDSVQRASLMINMGEMYASMSSYEQAMEKYNSVLLTRLSDKNLERSVKVWALTGIANVHKAKKDLDSAIRIYDEALAICIDDALGNEQANLLYNLGNIYLQQGATDTAMAYTEKALAIAGRKGVAELLPGIYTVLGKIHRAQKDYPASVALLQRSIDLAHRDRMLVEEKDAWEALSNTYTDMQQPALAFTAYKNFIAIRDSVFNIAKANEFTRKDLQFAYNKRAHDLAAAHELNTQRQRILIYCAFGALAVVLLLSFFIYRNYKLQKRANRIIKREKQVSENLLLNILPVDAATELKRRGTVAAKLYKDVTVMFTDFVNFTEAGERLSPEELVAELHECFKAFDGIITKYKIEKIKTVGDAYIAVSGLPVANPNHAADIVRAAVEFAEFMIARKQQLGDKTFAMRIGINSGTVIAGIVGVKKFAYDIWGDTVNTAARMEQYSEPGKVNISQSTYDLVKDELRCTYRGEIAAKNKGLMRMYFAEAATVSLSDASSVAAV